MPMGEGEPITDLSHEFDFLRDGDGPPVPDDPAPVDSVKQFHHDVRTLALVAHIVYGNDVRMLQLGADAGLNPTTLRACVSAPETVDSVRKGIAEGISLSIDSTPTTFVNGRAVVGPNEPLLRQYINF